METGKEKEYREVLAARREAYKKQQRLIDEERNKLIEKAHVLRQEFKAGNKVLHDNYNAPTAHSCASHRKRDAYNIQRHIQRDLREWKTCYLDMAATTVRFKMGIDAIELTINIPIPEGE